MKHKMVKEIIKRLFWKGWRESGVLLIFGCCVPLIGILSLMHTTGVKQMSVAGCIMLFNGFLLFVYSGYTTAGWNNKLFQNRIPLSPVYRYFFSYLIFLMIPVLIAVFTGSMLIYWKRIIIDNLYSFQILYLSEWNIVIYLMVLALSCYLCVAYIYSLFFYRVFNFNNLAKFSLSICIMLVIIFFMDSDIDIILLEKFLLMVIIAILFFEISLKFNHKTKKTINITVLLMMVMITIFPQLFRFTSGFIVQFFKLSDINNISINQNEIHSDNYTHHVKIEKIDANNTIKLTYIDDITKKQKSHTFNNFVYVMSVADNDSGVLIEQINPPGYTSSLLRWQPETDKVTVIANKPVPDKDNPDEYFKYIDVNAYENYVILGYQSSSSAANQYETWLIDMEHSKAKIIAIAPFYSMTQKVKWKNNEVEHYIYNRKINVTLPDMNVKTEVFSLSEGGK